MGGSYPEGEKKVLGGGGCSAPTGLRRRRAISRARLSDTPTPTQHPALVDLPSSIPDDDDENQGVILFWINCIYRWMLEMSTSPLGDRNFARCFEVLCMRWKGRETDGGEETAGVKGGVFTQVKLPTVHSILSAAQYHFKLSWAFQKEVFARMIGQGLRTVASLTAAELLIWDGDMQNR